MIDAPVRELGTYLLPGRVVDPSLLAEHARDAEAAGLGSVWLSERWDQKELGVLVGAAGAVTHGITVGAGITHPHTRHPVVLAAMGTTMQMLTGGRFVLGFGRSGPAIWSTIGLRPVSTEMLRDIPRVLRKLWARESFSYKGPLGDFPNLQMNHVWEGAPPPLLAAAVGPKSLNVVGEVYDGLFHHAFTTPETVARQVVAVRDAAERAGRDPSALRFIATLVCAPNLDDGRAAAVMLGRIITYIQFPGSGDVLVEANGWDPAVLAAVRSHPLFAGDGVYADQAFTLEQLAEVGKLLPEEWVQRAGCTGTPADVARRAQQYFEAGATEVCLHGSVPVELAPVVREFRTLS